MKSACTHIEQLYNGFSKLPFSATVQGSRFKEIEVPLLNQEEYLHCRNQLVHAIEVSRELVAGGTLPPCRIGEI
jgi:hypothetical protein